LAGFTFTIPPPHNIQHRKTFLQIVEKKDYLSIQSKSFNQAHLAQGHPLLRKTAFSFNKDLAY